MSFPVGTHRVTAYVDIPGSVDSGNGCNASAGCIIENPQPNNELDITVTVTEPTLTLGSFLIDGPNPTIAPGSRREDPTRDYQGETKPVGIFWGGGKIQWNTCVGSSFNDAGQSLSDFDGQRDGSITGFANRHDINIDEPGAGSDHFYSIRCTTTNGDQIFANHTITNGASVNVNVRLRPDVAPVPEVMINEVVNEITFNVENTSSNDATGVTYSLSIDGVTQGASDRSIADIAAFDTQTITSPLGWSSNVAGSFLLVATVDAANLTGAPVPDSVIIQVRAPQCSNSPIDDDNDGLVDELDPGCWTDPSDPSTYDPTDDTELNNAVAVPNPPTIEIDGLPIVRQGDDFTLRWNTNGNMGCVLSSNVGVTDAYVSPGETDLTARNQSTYTIECDNNQSDRVRLQVIPNMFET